MSPTGALVAIQVYRAVFHKPGDCSHGQSLFWMMPHAENQNMCDLTPRQTQKKPRWHEPAGISSRVICVFRYLPERHCYCGLILLDYLDNFLGLYSSRLIRYSRWNFAHCLSRTFVFLQHLSDVELGRYTSSPQLYLLIISVRHSRTLWCACATLGTSMLRAINVPINFVILVIIWFSNLRLVATFCSLKLNEIMPRIGISNSGAC